MPLARDLKHLGLIASAGAAVALRFFSDFSFATIQHQAALANLGLGRVTLAAFGALFLNFLSYELQRDWFNLSPQAPPEVIGLVIALLAAYWLLRRALSPESAAVTVLLSTTLLPLLATLGACAVVLLRGAGAA